MKKSISVWSFPSAWPLERKLKLAAEAGFAGFEIDLTEDGPVNLKSRARELAEVRNSCNPRRAGKGGSSRAREPGGGIRSISFGFFPEQQIASAGGFPAHSSLAGRPWSVKGARSRSANAPTQLTK